MGVRIGIALYDSVTDTAFGPVFFGEASAEDFLDWCLDHHGDPRRLSEGELETLVATWRDTVEKAAE